MKIISYGVTSTKGFERCENEREQRKRMKQLHQEKIQPIPLVLVEGLPGQNTARWLEFNKYKKLLKKEEIEHGNK